MRSARLEFFASLRRENAVFCEVRQFLGSRFCEKNAFSFLSAGTSVIETSSAYVRYFPQWWLCSRWCCVGDCSNTVFFPATEFRFALVEHHEDAFASCSGGEFTSLWAQLYTELRNLDWKYRSQLATLNVSQGFSDKVSFLKRLSWYGAIRVPAQFQPEWSHYGPVHWTEPTSNSKIPSLELYFDPTNKVYKHTMLETWPGFLEQFGLSDEEKMAMSLKPSWVCIICSDSVVSFAHLVWRLLTQLVNV